MKTAGRSPGIRGSSSFLSRRAHLLTTPKGRWYFLRKSCALRGGLRLLRQPPDNATAPASAAVIVCAIGQIPSLQPTLFLQPPAQTCHRQLCRSDGRASCPSIFSFAKEKQKKKRGDQAMAIYHLEAKVGSRGAGRSAVAASAYLSCSRLYNDYDGIQHDYTRKQGLVWQGVAGVYPGAVCVGRNVCRRCHSRCRRTQSARSHFADGAPDG